VQAVARRSSYLALLEEQPAARRRLVAVFARSAFLAERIIGQPLLLDDVLDPRIDQLPLKRADVAAEIGRALSALDERDAEGELDRLNELQSSIGFRLGLAFSDDRADAAATSRRLAALAEAVVGAVLSMAERELKAQHGSLPGESTGFAVLGYGSLGGAELGFASDLDLVFVYDGARAAARSDGARPLDGAQWYQRLAQRIVHWLGALTRGGKLYEIDTRLRPDGAKGLLVTSVDAFAGYQNERAWTWEHQALVRARGVAGDAVLLHRFEQVREQTLARSRDAAQLREDVLKMRARMRAELDRSDAARFDLKQGAGGLVDLEFLLQAGVLLGAAQQPELTVPRATPALIDALAATSAWCDAPTAVALHEAHATLVDAGLACTLDRRPRLTAITPAIEHARAAIAAAAQAKGLAFEPGRSGR
jgi:glutamate-ammonia-ligase adenylyltransferase